MTSRAGNAIKLVNARTVHANNPALNSIFVPNKISNTKYTPYDFLFKNLYEQFSRFMNFYFLIIAFLQLWYVISPVSPMVLIKEGLDDYWRHVQDSEANSRLVIVVRNGAEQEIASQEVIVGDIVKVQENDEICCDMTMLVSSDRDGSCYIQTSNLDGETDLKPRNSLPEFQNMSLAEIRQCKAVIECAAPNAEIYKFDSRIKKNDDSKEWLSLSSSQLLLQSTHLRNTDWVYGLVVYSGNETKMGMNKRTPPSKWTTADRTINRISMMIFTFQLLITISFGIGGSIWQIHSKGSDWYLGYYFEGSNWYDNIVIPLRFLLLMSLMIPISLKVTLDITKYFYSWFINWDVKMWDSDLKIGATASNTSISEDMGQIEYIFTDKTGTLTENIMTFKRCSINGTVYGKIPSEEDVLNLHRSQSSNLSNAVSASLNTKSPRSPLNSANSDAYADVYGNGTGNNNNNTNNDYSPTGGSGGSGNKTPNNNRDNNQQIQSSPQSSKFDKYDIENYGAISDPNLHQAIQDGDPDAWEFFRCLAICHSVVAVLKKDEIQYKASSPDEEALVKAAASCGFIYYGREGNILDICIFGAIESYELLQVLEFSSERKRMSVIVRNLFSGQVILYSKGADDVILARTSASMDKTTINEQLETFASSGLRTLCIAKRVIPQEEFLIWTSSFKNANSSLVNRNEKLAETYNQLEKNLSFLGVTAIEDKLQGEVPETISLLRKAGLVFWMLTGDKFSTAVQIALSCNLISDTTFLRKIEGSTFEEINNNLTQYQQEAETRPNEKFLSVIVEGSTLGLVLEKCKPAFLKLCLVSNAVICCRVTPQQKALVVKLIKDNNHMTLAIGDGGNDVSMIQEAHIGVGISGREGKQAARAADYQIGKFRFLRRLILIHGRYSYYRSAYIAQFSFYKSMAFGAIQLFYAFQTAFSGSTLFNTFQITAYNILFTGLQIFCYALDKDVSEESMYLHPKLYDDGRLGRLLNVRTFIPWFLLAWFQAIIVFTFTVFAYNASTVYHDLGYPVDYLALSTPTYTALIFIVQLTLSYDTHLFTRIHIVIYCGIMLFYFLASVLYSDVSSFEYYKVFNYFLSEISFWLFNIITIFVCVSPRVAMMYYFFNYLPTESEKVGAEEHEKRQKLKNLPITSLSSSSSLHVVGYNNNNMGRKGINNNNNNNNTIEMASLTASSPNVPSVSLKIDKRRY